MDTSDVILIQFVVLLVCAVVGCAVNYYIIKTAVRDGAVEAYQTVVMKAPVKQTVSELENWG